METQTNYKKVIHSLFILDSILSGNTPRDSDIINGDDISFMSLVLNKNIDGIILSPYIEQTINTFKTQKSHYRCYIY